MRVERKDNVETIGRSIGKCGYENSRERVIEVLD